MGQAGERLFPDARYPHEYVLARPDIEFAVECDDGDVLADNVIGRDSVGLESHVDVKAHLLACLISAGSEVLIQIGKKTTDVLGIHAGQPGARQKSSLHSVRRLGSRRPRIIHHSQSVGRRSLVATP